MNLDCAKRYAGQLLELLGPYCERIEVAGSIRREKCDNIGDIELVAIPKTGADPASMFPSLSPPVSLLDAFLDRLPAGSSLVRDLHRPPHWGPRSKRMRFCGVPVDLFIVLPPAQWGVIFAIRTGPESFARALVTPLSHGGFLPAGMRIESGQLIRSGVGVIETPNEQDLFDAIALRNWHPTERSEITG